MRCHIWVKAYAPHLGYTAQSGAGTDLDDGRRKPAAPTSGRVERRARLPCCLSSACMSRCRRWVDQRRRFEGALQAAFVMV